MQTSTENLLTFLPHSLPFLCQPAGVTGTVVLQPTVATFQVQEQSAVPEESQPEESQEQAEKSEDVEVSEGQLEADKQQIYDHPLFPLMTKLFEKCEKATVSGGNGISSENFDEDILTFVRQQEQCGKPFFIDSPEVDGLMVRAIQVLRIHVLEIEKVGELCKDFCQRYITSLKTKLSSEQLLGEVGDCGSFVDDDMLSSPDVMQQSVNALAQSQVVSGGTVYQMVQTPHGLVAQPIQLQQQIIASTQPLANTSLLSAASSTPVIDGLAAIVGCSQSNFDDDEENQRKLKRGVLPKRATQIMKSWLFQHIAHPYPTEDEKRQIAAQTNLTLLQVNNWFINGRRRILQPMLDSAGTASAEAKPKANKGSTKSAQRFWPENIANLQYRPSASVTEDSDSQFSVENGQNVDLAESHETSDTEESSETEGLQQQSIKSDQQTSISRSQTLVTTSVN